MFYFSLAGGEGSLLLLLFGGRQGNLLVQQLFGLRCARSHGCIPMSSVGCFLLCACWVSFLGGGNRTAVHSVSVKQSRAQQ